MAWPIGWPKFSTARRPVSSRSSRETTSALSWQLRATIRRKASVVALQDLVGLVLQLGEERTIEDDAVLDDLGQPATKLPIRQGLQRLGVDPDAGRLVERPDDVLGLWMIDPDLAPDRAIHLGEEGRRDHDQGEPPA